MKVCHLAKKDVRFVSQEFELNIFFDIDAKFRLTSVTKSFYRFKVNATELQQARSRRFQIALFSRKGT
jgi:hypothetical protein